MIIKGTVWKYADNVNTDEIIPARYLNTFEESELAQHCMEDIDATFASHVQKGDIIVGGKNFGCGSSREHAPIAIKASGVSLVIAETFARIFFRNAINIGLPIMECPLCAREARKGYVLAVDLEKGVVRNETIQKEYTAAPYPPFMQELISAGGLLPWVKQAATTPQGNAGAKPSKTKK